MKKGIHPTYKDAKIICACGNVISTRSTVGDMRVEICSACHPFYTGVQKIIESTGSVMKFKKKYEKVAAKTVKTKETKKKIRKKTSASTKTKKEEPSPKN